MTQRPPRPTPIQQPLSPALPQMPNIPPPNVAPLPPAPTPAPQREPAPPKRVLNARNCCLYDWGRGENGNNGIYVCLQCASALYGSAFVDRVLLDGWSTRRDHPWVSRVDNPTVKCDICQPT